VKRNPYRDAWRNSVLAICALLLGVGVLSAYAQRGDENSDEPPPSVTMASTNGSMIARLEANGTSIREVLKAVSRQAGRNIVIGPDVTNSVHILLTDISYEDALDVILKNYGYGFREVGNTIVVNRLDQLAAFEQIEPTESHVFNLKYLDAEDVEDIVTSMLSPRGSVSTVTVRGQVGWRFESGGGQRAGGGGSGGGSTLGKRERAGNEEGSRSKTLIVTDIPGTIARVIEVMA